MFDPFEYWPSNDVADSNRRLVDPPRPVLVELGLMVPRPAGKVEPLPLRVRQGGVRLVNQAPGQLLAWARMIDGHWLALVRVEVPAGQGCLPMLQWVASRAVRLADNDPQP